MILLPAYSISATQSHLGRMVRQARGVSAESRQAQGVKPGGQGVGERSALPCKTKRAREFYQNYQPSLGGWGSVSWSIVP